MTIKDLAPALVWKNFYGLTQIPRPSKHEEKVQKYLYDWGVSHGLETLRDETGNIIIRKGATPGFEKRRGVILQGHMDMVPQKTAETKHDFLTDPISTRIVDGWVAAEGTTLGADNGIGIALALAILEDPSAKHGPLEVLCTYDEETGMTGANELRPGVLKGDILINVDSEEEGELCVGCAGGLDATADFRYRSYRTPEGFVGYKVAVKGLQGGHSGMDISLYRANANKAVARILLPLIEKHGVKVADFTGGSLRNAIPFEAAAEIVIPLGEVRKVKTIVEKIFAEIKAEFCQSDPSAELVFEKQPHPAPKYIQESVMLRAVKAMLACPAGVIRMSRSMEGLTETSTNMAIVRTGKGHLTIHSLMRSAVDSSKAYLAERMRCLFELAGAEISFAGGYSGWTPKLDTPMNKVMMDQFQKVYGRPMKIMATHGGLECAIMGAKYPAWEMVSIGPTIVHPHSPDERVKIDSVGRTYDYLKAVLENVPEAK